MKPLHANVDYEDVLFRRAPSEKVNRTFEYLALLLEDRALRTSKIYDSAYLSYLKDLLGRPVTLVPSGEAENWWGALVDLALERRLNSKLTFAEFVRGPIIVRRESDIPPSMAPLLWRGAIGRSGQGSIVTTVDNFESQLHRIHKALKFGPLIVTPLRERVKDFSSYLTLTGELLTYQNLVDQHFQYKGTVVPPGKLDEKGLSFYGEIELGEWDHFLGQREQICAHYLQLAGRGGFGLDAFVYRDGGRLKIEICEVNYRRTMGITAIELARKFAPGEHVLFLLIPGNQGLENLLKLRERHPWLLPLSPGDQRFDSLLISAPDNVELVRRYQIIRALLPESQLPIEI